MIRACVCIYQATDLSADQLLLSLGLRSIMRERGLDPQEDAALKKALPPLLRHASVVRVGKAQVSGGRAIGRGRGERRTGRRCLVCRGG